MKAILLMDAPEIVPSNGRLAPSLLPNSDDSSTHEKNLPLERWLFSGSEKLRETLL